VTLVVNVSRSHAITMTPSYGLFVRWTLLRNNLGFHPYMS
jgi:hypothetical protein